MGVTGGGGRAASGATSVEEGQGGDLVGCDYCHERLAGTLELLPVQRGGCATALVANKWCMSSHSPLLIFVPHMDMRLYDQS